MDIERTRRTTIFITGPVDEVEGQLAELNDEWTALDFWYHAIQDKACVTVRLVPTKLMRQMQIANARTQLAPRMH